MFRYIRALIGWKKHQEGVEDLLDGVENTSHGFEMDEKIPLTCSDTGRTSYETITTTENAIIYCCHGNPPENCCDDKIMLSSSGLPNGRERRISTTSEGHCHPEREEGIDKHARIRLLIVSALCLVFMVGECVDRNNTRREE
ncbi:uncharacterized protein LOC111083742 [Limulus polyphemus]|uniref:Uncharacterized protein LOC111083742 n=1 Tax=Limulus polyphemus TaxID=6850 RepID=A0ABM1RXL0_LIMPO|nr:uncharacterized protein LOC111083742 [Limulus polyphemus]